MRLHQVAALMNIKAPTALNLIRRLERKNLVEIQDGMAMLTKKGEETVIRILLVHRTYESLLCQSGVPKETACEEVAEVDYLMSEDNARLVLKKIGSPEKCPHGKPIPMEELH
jgi:DtxR family Mn-dependent transcriptional regulator